MSSPANASGSSSLPRLGPAWYKGAGNQGGRGFQPPPAVPAERVTRSRSGSAGSTGSETKRDVNKFSALQDDDEVVGGNGEKWASGNSRSEALRAPGFHRSPSGGTKPAGRSLADLAARVPAATLGRSSSNSAAVYREEGNGGSGRFSGLRTTDGDGPSTTTVKVIRFTREKLLSMRPAPKPDDVNPPPQLAHLEGNAILSAVPQDPVCWDTLDAEEIWAQVPRERLPRTTSMPVPKVGMIPSVVPPAAAVRSPSEGTDERKRGPPGGPSIGRWQRGVALPPPDESGRRGSRVDADNPNELWDDPVGGVTAAAPDFSAFGMIPDDPKVESGGGSGDAFDFDEMAEASRQFDLERRGSKSSDASEGEDSIPHVHSVQVDPHRPLASAGTTIRSGSGDDVNVFEDFESPGESEDAPAPVKASDAENSASSRLMKMIGVNSDVPAELSPDPNVIPAWGPSEANPEPQDPVIPTASSFIPSNPWGGPIIASGASQSQQSGMDLAARLEAVVAEQKARDAQVAAELERRKAQEAEMLRLRRREEEEAQLRALHAQKQAAEQQSNAGGGHSQVELILMERISVILENSWGRSDLLSILSTLHAEDSRVVPLLGNVDSLRALIIRHPRRIALRPDPAFGTEMATLLVTNAQWQQQAQAVARAQQEEIQRREQQRRLQAMQQAAAAREKAPVPTVVPDAPWFYSDPQNNIQGPFRGEEMRQWLEAGYFKGDLPISQQRTGPFLPLSTIFPDLSIAFKAPDTTEEEDDAQERAAAIAAEEETRARQAQERRAAEEVEAAAAAAAAEVQVKASEQNQSSTQLKMLLGLGSNENVTAEESESLPDDMEEDDSDRKGGQMYAGGSHDRAATRSNNTSGKTQQLPSDNMSSASAKPSAVPAWGGATAAAPRKSISEIQQEEARAAARLAMERKAIPRSSSGGWANVAASGGGSTAWSSGAVKPTTGAVMTNPNAPPANARMVLPRQAGQGPNPQRPSGAGQLQRSSSQATGDDFGATMPPALENWCKDQMRKLNGSDDLTLVSFCMTLTDAVEIRQYLTAYLGTTPQVNNFATEFINRKDGNKGVQEEWESAGTSKKGRKKKVGPK